MRSDVLSQRVFIAGCFGLPWLWIVHVLYHHQLKEAESETSTNPDDHFPDGQQGVITPEQIRLSTQKWVRRCKIGAVVYTVVFLAWIVLAQVLQKTSVLPPSLYMLSADDADVTGW